MKFLEKKKRNTLSLFKEMIDFKSKTKKYKTIYSTVKQKK